MRTERPDACTTHYTLQREHFHHSGNYMLPVAGSSSDTTAECAIVELHSPYETTCITWTATRIGGPPKVPSPYTLEPNLKFLYGKRIGKAPMPEDAGRADVWTLSGQYFYANKRPRYLNSDFPLAKMPLYPDSTPAEEFTVPGDKFSTNLIAKDPADRSRDNPIPR